VLVPTTQKVPIIGGRLNGFSFFYALDFDFKMTRFDGFTGFSHLRFVKIIVMSKCQKTSGCTKILRGLMYGTTPIKVPKIMCRCIPPDKLGIGEKHTLGELLKLRIPHKSSEK
jgi:hypothetical protein